MDPEIKDYFLWNCHNWMLTHEIIALRRSSLTAHGEETTRKAAKKSEEWESRYGFQNEAINNFVALGLENLHNAIANRMLKEHPELLNYCPKCNKLARTPKARQCRHCNYKWFHKPVKVYT